MSWWFSGLASILGRTLSRLVLRGAKPLWALILFKDCARGQWNWISLIIRAASMLEADTTQNFVLNSAYQVGVELQPQRRHICTKERVATSGKSGAVSVAIWIWAFKPSKNHMQLLDTTKVAFRVTRSALLICPPTAWSSTKPGSQILDFGSDLKAYMVIVRLCLCWESLKAKAVFSRLRIFQIVSWGVCEQRTEQPKYAARSTSRNFRLSACTSDSLLVSWQHF